MKTLSFFSKLVVAQSLFASIALPAFAENSSQPLTPTPIPPVVTGTIDLEEIRVTNIVELLVSRSRTFKLSNKIIRTSISDPGIAEPVVIAGNEIILLGKSPGTVTLVLWDDAGNTAAMTINVSRHALVQTPDSFAPKSQSGEQPPIANESGTENAAANVASPNAQVDASNAPKAQAVRTSGRGIKMVPAGNGVVMMGDVESTEALIRGYSGATSSNDDRGINIQAANNRLTNSKPGEVGVGGSK